MKNVSKLLAKYVPVSELHATKVGSTCSLISDCIDLALQFKLPNIPEVVFASQKYNDENGREKVISVLEIKTKHLLSFSGLTPVELYQSVVRINGDKPSIEELEEMEVGVFINFITPAIEVQINEINIKV